MKILKILGSIFYSKSKEPSDRDYAGFISVIRYVVDTHPMEVDSHTENFLIGEEYKNIPTHVKMYYLINSLNRAIILGGVERSLTKIKRN